MIPADWFNGPSLLDSGGRYSALPGRTLIANELVDVYRNLNRPNSFSIKPWQGAYFHAWRSLNNIQADQLITSMPITQ